MISNESGSYHQCDQMTISCAEFLAIYNNGKILTMAINANVG